MTEQTAEHRSRYAAVALITAVEAEEAAHDSLAPEALGLPALPDELHALADPFGVIADPLPRRRKSMSPMTLSTTTETPTTIDLRADADYARAVDRLADLTARVAALDRRREALQSGPAGDILTHRAHALIEDDVVPRSADAARHAARQDLEAVTDEPAVTREAVRLQQATVEQARLRVSEAICLRLRPRHRAIVGRIAGAIAELDAALADEQALRESLNDAGVTHTTTLRPMPLRGFGRLTDAHSGASHWLADAREHGLL